MLYMFTWYKKSNYIYFINSKLRYRPLFGTYTHTHTHTHTHAHIRTHAHTSNQGIVRWAFRVRGTVRWAGARPTATPDNHLRLGKVAILICIHAIHNWGRSSLPIFVSLMKRSKRIICGHEGGQHGCAREVHVHGRWRWT